MSGAITLLGAEEVTRASSRMGSAADDMQRAAASFDTTADRLIRALNDAALLMVDAAERIERAMAQGSAS